MDDHRDWGWQIVNYAKYQAMRDEEGRREYMRKYMSEYRKERKQLLTPVNTCKPPLAPVAVAVSVAVSEKRESKARPADIRALTEYFSELGMPETEAQKFNDFYASKGWLVGKSPMKDWRAASRNWLKGYAARKAPAAQKSTLINTWHDESNPLRKAF
jgi:hypothetical protein